MHFVAEVLAFLGLAWPSWLSAKVADRAEQTESDRVSRWWIPLFERRTVDSGLCTGVPTLRYGF